MSGAGAVRTIAGTMSIHMELERRLAAFKKTEAVVVFQSGFTANAGTVSSILTKDDVIISDELNHASIIDGCRLSKALIKPFPHKDIDAARKILKDLPAETATSGVGYEQLSGPRGVADDLKKLTGVSLAIERKLNDLGIFHYSQIAAFGGAAVYNVGEEVGLPGRVDGWVAQARALTAEALDFAAARCGGISPDVRAKLIEAYERLDAYADVKPTLAALKERMPMTNVIVHEGAMETMLPDLRRGALDMVVGRLSNQVHARDLAGARHADAGGAVGRRDVADDNAGPHVHIAKDPRARS